MAAESHAAEQAPTAGEYIVHHLTHLRNKELNGPFDLSVVSWDSMFFSIVIGVLGCFFLWKAARKATSGVPGRFQAAVEILVEIVETQAKGIVHNANSRKLVAPLRSRSSSGSSCSTRWICCRWTCFLSSGKRSTWRWAVTPTTPICASFPPPICR